MKIEMLRWCTVLALASVASGNANAQSAEEMVDDPLTGYTKGSYPSELIHRPWALPRGMMEITALGYFNLTQNSIGKPTFLAPAVYYGVDDLISVGVAHSLGLCLRGCVNFNRYNDVAAEATFLLSGPKSPTQFALVGGLDFSNFNPVMAGLHYGLDGRLVLGPLALTFKPRIYVGIVNRNSTIVLAGQFSGLSYGKERVDVPVQLQLQIFSHLALFAQSGFAAPIESGPSSLTAPGFFKAYVVPLGGGLLISVTNRFDLGLMAAFNNFGGKNHTTDARVASFWISVRL
jgi:hypothetical protein